MPSMKTLIIFAFLFIALFSFSGCAVMGEIVIAMILPAPPPPLPPENDLQIIIIDQPTPTLSGSYTRREIQTGRGSLHSGSSPASNDEENKGSRDSGIQRNRHTDSNPAPARTYDGTKETREPGARRH
jgi:hypothetical protein